jgi:hypothetical protein
MTDDPASLPVEFDPTDTTLKWSSWTAEEDWVPSIGADASSPETARAEVQRNWTEFRSHVLSRHLDDDSLLHGVEKVYSTSRCAEFFGRSTQWVYWGLRPDPRTGQQPFSYKDGSPIQPERVGPMGKRRFTLPIIREIALACYRRGAIKEEEELETVMAKILIAEFGVNAFSDSV